MSRATQRFRVLVRPGRSDRGWPEPCGATVVSSTLLLFDTGERVCLAGVSDVQRDKKIITFKLVRKDMTTQALQLICDEDDSVRIHFLLATLASQQGVFLRRGRPRLLFGFEWQCLWVSVEDEFKFVYTNMNNGVRKTLDLRDCQVSLEALKSQIRLQIPTKSGCGRPIYWLLCAESPEETTTWFEKMEERRKSVTTTSTVPLTEYPEESFMPMPESKLGSGPNGPKLILDIAPTKIMNDLKPPTPSSPLPDTPQTTQTDISRAATRGNTPGEKSPGWTTKPGQWTRSRSCSTFESGAEAELEVSKEERRLAIFEKYHRREPPVPVTCTSAVLGQVRKTILTLGAESVEAERELSRHDTPLRGLGSMDKTAQASGKCHRAISPTARSRTSTVHA